MIFGTKCNDYKIIYIFPYLMEHISVTLYYIVLESHATSLSRAMFLVPGVDTPFII